MVEFTPAPVSAYALKESALSAPSRLGSNDTTSSAPGPIPRHAELLVAIQHDAHWCIRGRASSIEAKASARSAP